MRNTFSRWCLSKDSLSGSYGRLIRVRRTRNRFHSGGLTSLSGQVFLKLLNILLITILAAKFISPREKTWLRVARYLLTKRPDSFSSLDRYKKNSAICEAVTLNGVIPSMTSMEESRTLSLVDTGCRSPEVWTNHLCNLFQKASPLDKLLDNFHMWSCSVFRPLWNFLMCGWTRRFHSKGSSRGSPTRRESRSANHSF